MLTFKNIQKPKPRGQRGKPRSEFVSVDMGQFACATGVRFICCEVDALEAVEIDMLGLSSMTPACLLVGGSRRQEGALSLCSEVSTYTRHREMGRVACFFCKG